MEIVKGQVTDIEEVLSVFKVANKHLQEQGIHQWDDQYPSRGLLVADAEKECLFGIVEDGCWIAAMVIDDVQEEPWKNVDWEYTKGRILCIHRLVVNPEVQGKGLGKKLLQFAEEYAGTHGYASIRLDAYNGNPSALAFYERLGYVNSGSVTFPRFELPYSCFEKQIVRYCAEIKGIGPVEEEVTLEVNGMLLNVFGYSQQSLQVGKMYPIVLNIDWWETMEEVTEPRQGFEQVGRDFECYIYGKFHLENHQLDAGAVIVDFDYGTVADYGYLHDKFVRLYVSRLECEFLEK